MDLQVTSARRITVNQYLLGLAILPDPLQNSVVIAYVVFSRRLKLGKPGWNGMETLFFFCDAQSGWGSCATALMSLTRGQEDVQVDHNRGLLVVLELYRHYSVPATPQYFAEDAGILEAQDLFKSKE
jgi:hypothetical protein